MMCIAFIIGLYLYLYILCAVQINKSLQQILYIVMRLTAKAQFNINHKVRKIHAQHRFKNRLGNRLHVTELICIAKIAK